MNNVMSVISVAIITTTVAVAAIYMTIPMVGIVS